MTSEELKMALLSGAPVVLDHPYMGKIRYNSVQGILYQKSKTPGKDVDVSAILFDYNGNSRIQCDPRHLSFWTPVG